MLHVLDSPTRERERERGREREQIPHVAHVANIFVHADSRKRANVGAIEDDG